MIKNKKAWLRILEAFIAIMLIGSVLIVLYAKVIKPGREEVYNLQKTILDEIADNPELRNAVLNFDEKTVSDFVKDRIPYGFDFTIRICEVKNICGLQEYKENVYATERIISSTLHEYEPKKLKIFMWQD